MRTNTDPKCLLCCTTLHVTPWRLTQDADEEHRHLACYKCRSIKVERRPYTRDSVRQQGETPAEQSHETPVK